MERESWRDRETGTEKHRDTEGDLENRRWRKELRENFFPVSV